MKGQSEIIAVVLIVVISIGLVGTAYFWGLPLIQKRQDRAKVDRVASMFDPSNSNSLPSLVESIANNGGEATFTLDVKGLWQVHPADETSVLNNSISFTFFSKVSRVAPDRGWVSLTPPANCPPSFGILGEDRSSVVCTKADTKGSGYEITYIVFFRALNQTGTDNIYKIALSPVAASTSTGKNLRISNVGTEKDTTTYKGKTLIKTKINILLQ